MNCPLCIDEVLDVTHHGGIEVDICPRCRGIWLDRGELERLMADEPPVARGREPRPGYGRDPDPGYDRGGHHDDRGYDDDRGYRRDDRGKGGRPNRKKRLSERLGDVFEEVLDF